MKREKSIKILAIETSCDETAASIVEAKIKDQKSPLDYARGKKTKNINIKILSNIISSQVKLHAQYGGVYPELASRAHLEMILPVISRALAPKNKETKKQRNQFLSSSVSQLFSSVDRLAVTVGPGLIGSLLVGVNTAKTLAYLYQKPTYSINHLEAHIYSNFIRVEPKNKETKKDQKGSSVSQFLSSYVPKFPLVTLVVSGGHTYLVYMHKHLTYKVIGETLDDAAGEAFDKVAALLGLPYPGGPVIAAEAVKIPSTKSQFPNQPPNPKTKNQIHFPRPMIKSKDFDFSFSGLKTSVLYTIKKLPKPLASNVKSLICKEFQDAVVETLVAKTIRAARTYKAKSILLCGGVAANESLRDSLRLKTKNLRLRFFAPAKNLSTDNAAMVGAAAAYKIALGKKPTPWYNVNAEANAQLKT